MLVSSPLLTERNALRFIEQFIFAVTDIDILIFDLWQTHFNSLSVLAAI